MLQNWKIEFQLLGHLVTGKEGGGAVELGGNNNFAKRAKNDSFWTFSQNFAFLPRETKYRSLLSDSRLNFRYPTRGGFREVFVTPFRRGRGGGQGVSHLRESNPHLPTVYVLET